MKQYKAVFSDIDGTLLNTENKVTRRTLEAIRALGRRGIPFVIVSARSPAAIWPILEQNGFSCPVVAYSGGLILDENRRTLYHCGMDKRQAGEILRYLEEQRFDLSWNLFTSDEWIVRDKQDPRIRREEEAVQAQARQGSLGDLPEDAEINKVLCICAEGKILQIEEKVRERFPGCSVAKSSPILLEIMENRVNKATAIKTLCGLRNIDVENVIAFGDQYNDLEMLQFAGCGVAMGNAPTEIRRLAARTTLDNDHDGICHALLELGVIGPV
ncbi:Cof-type HAD-IIB family hydrolase [Christensenella intestinihominis]|uniref:Cof-type HAD-IIB family hydrolase n=1 Tax=Christensenella intestinihominis TaxID=1851429 RepID=UPI0008308FC9|nr:Cof-type HAD-IIB family hydrolase [Christensenella intestinihominis]